MFQTVLPVGNAGPIADREWLGGQHKGWQLFVFMEKRRESEIQMAGMQIFTQAAARLAPAA